jgi:hypothetical protein
MSTLQEYYPDSLTTVLDWFPQAEKERLGAQNARRETLYVHTRYLLTKRFGLGTDLTNGSAPWKIPVDPKGFATVTSNQLSDGEKAQFTAVFGILLVDGYEDPLLGRKVETMGADDLRNQKDDVNRPINAARQFVNAIVAAEQEYNADPDLFNVVFRELRSAGTVQPLDSSGNPSGDPVATLYAKQVALVTRRLIEQGIDASDPLLGHRISDALSVYLGATGEASSTDIDLPDLEDNTVAEVVADNVRALSAVYFAAMLEELKFFATADKLAEHFISGMLPLSRGPGGEAIYEYVRNAPNRMTEHERKSLYARTFGFAQGGVEEPLPNREFSDLWIRFLSNVSLGKRQTIYERAVVTPEQVFKSAKDLAVNLSLHGYGLAHFAAVELQRLTKTVKAMLSFQDVLAGYGARDWGQLVERISSMYLGGSVNGVRQRTMAATGASILQWAADNAAVLSMPTGSIDIGAETDVTRNDPTKPPLYNPKTVALVQNIERWLAVTGTTDSSVERFSEPISLPMQPTIPVFPGTNGQTFAPQSSMRDAMNRLATMNPLVGGNKPPAQA